MSKFQEVSSILKVDFALSKRPHFNSVYLLRVPSLNGIAVYHKVSKMIIDIETTYMYTPNPSVTCEGKYWSQKSAWVLDGISPVR